LKYQFRFNGGFGGYRAILFINRAIKSVYIILANYDLAPLDAIVAELDKNMIQNVCKKTVGLLEKQIGYYYAGDDYYMIIEKSNDCLIAHSCAISLEIENSDGIINKCIAPGTTTNNFIYPYGRLIFDDFDKSKFQVIKTNIDGIEQIGKRAE